MFRKKPPALPDDSAVSRRGFFRAFGGLAGIARDEGSEEGRRAPPPALALPQRVLGRTGVPVPILGFGTASLGRSASDEAAYALLSEALDLGVRLIDTASPEGGYGRAHLQVAQVLRRRRSEVILTTKVFEPDAAAGRRMLERSLEELGTDQVDVLYVHSLGHDRMDPAVVFGADGVMRMAMEAKREGLARFVGVTAHSRPARVVRALREYDVDVLMTAANFFDVHTYDFEGSIWPVAREKGVGLIAMKVFGGTMEGRPTPALLPRHWHERAFRYALSLEGCAAAVIGMVDRRELHENVQRVRAFTPLGAPELESLAQDGRRFAEDWGAHLGPVE